MKLTFTIAVASLTIVAAVAHSVSVRAAEFDGTSAADHRYALVGAETAGVAASHTPGSVGAMSAVVAGTAVSADDVVRQSRGQLTATPVFWRAKAESQPGF